MYLIKEEGESPFSAKRINSSYILSDFITSSTSLNSL